MPTALSLPRISTNVRFAASALLAPDLAGAWAERLFLTPPRPKDAVLSSLDLVDAKSGLLEHKGRAIATWTWGARSREAPAVLLAHGWGGNAAQMRGFVFPLLSAGYRVVAFDQPAHGVSEGRLTGLPDFADVLARVAWQAGIEERFGVRWSQLDAAKLAPRLAAPALVIHDWDDRAVPWSQGAELARHWRGAQLMTTRELGHRRILEDDAVTRAAADFIAGRASLPNPAPLY